MMLARQKHISLEKIEEEYLPDILNDTDESLRLKKVISELDELDRAILIIYSDTGSMSKTAKLFSVSPATIYSRISKIRQYIKDKLK